MNQQQMDVRPTMMTKEYPCARTHQYLVSCANSRIKKSSSVDMIAALAQHNLEQVEDATTCTAPCSESERTSYHSNGRDEICNKLYEHSSNCAGDEEDVGTHQAIIEFLDQKDDVNEVEKNTDEDEHQTLIDIPSWIVLFSTIPGSNDENCDDSVSTLGVDSLLNDNPRSIFSSYWNGKDPKDIPATVLSRSSSYGTNTMSTSASSPSIHSDLPDTMSQASTMKIATYSPENNYQEYNVSKNIPRCNSTDSHKEEYEMILRGHEVGKTTILRGALQNEERDTIDGCENDARTPHPNEQKPIHPSTSDLSRRSIFSSNYSKYEHEHFSYQYSDDYMHKVSSTSALLRRRSCLRPLSRSVSAAGRSDNMGVVNETGGKVTFDPNVKVVEYSRPCTVQASNGWSKWFV